MPAPARDHYQVLGLSESASRADVRAAFLRLIRTTHPDANQGLNKPASEDVARIIAAYRCLRDDAARARYDRDRHAPRQAVILLDHAPPIRPRTLRQAVMRGIVGAALIACASGAIYLLAADRGGIGSVFSPERATPSPANRLREQLQVEAGLDVDWVMTVYGPNMLGPLSRQCFTADVERRSRAQCAYCLAFDEAAASAVPGDAYFGDNARAARRESCPA